MKLISTFINPDHYVRKWINPAQVIGYKDEKNVKILYVGSNYESRQHLSGMFSPEWSASDFAGAHNLLKLYSQSFSSTLPDAILIDYVLNNDELKQWHLFLTQSHSFSVIPLLYAADKVDYSQLRSSRYFNIIDDVIELKETQPGNLLLKILLIKKYKFERKNIQINAEELIRENIVNTGYFFKMLFDSFLALLAIVFLSPLLLLIAIAVKLDSRGPVFYASPRAGRGYKIFKFYKFRSMVVDADQKMETLSALNQYAVNEKGPKFFKVSNDPRITRMGKFLRNTSLDELPQLFNVLKGEMSLVGNRPLPLYEAETLTTNKFVERFMAPAGITGLWQVKKRGKSDMSIDERIDLDIAYARRANPLLDLQIILSTPLALFQKSSV